MPTHTGKPRMKGTMLCIRVLIYFKTLRCMKLLTVNMMHVSSVIPTQQQLMLRNYFNTNPNVNCNANPIANCSYPDVPTQLSIRTAILQLSRQCRYHFVPLTGMLQVFRQMILLSQHFLYDFNMPPHSSSFIPVSLLPSGRLKPEFLSLSTISTNHSSFQNCQQEALMPRTMPCLLFCCAVH